MILSALLQEHFLYFITNSIALASIDKSKPFFLFFPIAKEISFEKFIMLAHPVNSDITTVIETRKYDIFAIKFYSILF